MNILNINQKWFLYLTIIVGLLVVASVSNKLYFNFTDSEVNFKTKLTSELIDFENGDYIYWQIDENKKVDNLVITFMPSDNERYPYEHKENNWYNKLTYSVEVSSGAIGADVVLDKIKSDILLLVNKNTDLSHVEYFNDKHTVGVLLNKVHLSLGSQNYTKLDTFYLPIMAIFIVILLLYISNLLYKQIGSKKYAEANLTISALFGFCWYSISIGTMEIVTIFLLLTIFVALLGEALKIKRQNTKENLEIAS